MTRPLIAILLALGACASPETQRGTTRHGSLVTHGPTSASDAKVSDLQEESTQPGLVIPPPPTPGPEAPPVLESLTPWFSQPPLDEALAAWLDGDANRSLPIIEAFLEGNPHDSRVPAARLLSAWLLADRDPSAAAERFAAVALEWPLMADFALLRQAELAVDTPKAALAVDTPKAALATLARLPSDTIYRGRALALQSRLLASQPEGGKAARAVLEEAVRSSAQALLPESWQALIERRAMAGEAALAEAARLELAVRYPQDALGKEALSRLGLAHLGGTQRVRLGRALFEAGRYDAMRQVLSGRLRPKTAACEAWILLGRAAERKKKEDDRALLKAFAFYEKALACEGKPRADATFLGGRVRLGTHPKQGKKLLSAHAKEFPLRSTADDALLLLAESETRPKRAMKALLSTLRHYPQGDMADAVAWDIVGPQVEARHWKGVLAATEQILALVPGDVASRHPGRYRYWRGRALWELGQADLARAEWRRAFTNTPLSWYAILAYARLASPAGLLPEGSADTGPPDLRVGATLWRDVHFRRAVEWARLAGASQDKASPFFTMVDLELDRVPERVRPQGDDWTWTRIAVQQLGGGFPRSMRLARTLEATSVLPFPIGLAALTWKLAYPRPFFESVTRWATERALDPNWIWAVMRVESNFDPQAVSWANAIGLMQIILPTAQNLARDTGIQATREALMRPEVALELGTKYLQRLLDRHKVVPLASAGYNAGGGAVAKWRRQFGDLDLDEFVERIPYREANLYAKSVTQTLARYLWLYQGKLLALDLAPVGSPDAALAPTE